MRTLLRTRRLLAALAVGLLCLAMARPARANCWLCPSFSWTPQCSSNGPVTVTMVINAPPGTNVDNVQVYVKNLATNQVVFLLDSYGVHGAAYLVFTFQPSLAPGAYGLYFTEVYNGVITLADNLVGSFGVASGPPTSAASYSGAAKNPPWFGPGSVTLTAVGGGGGCVPAGTTIHYQLNGAAWQLYSAPLPLGDGLWKLAYFATSGTYTEPTNTQSYSIDGTAPVASATFSSAVMSGGWLAAPISFQITATDATSGLANVQYSINGGAWTSGASGSFSGPTGLYTLNWRATDQAGNLAAGSVSGQIDATPPTGSVVVPSPDGKNGWFITDPTLTISATDAQSGVAWVASQLDGGSWVHGASLKLTTHGVHQVNWRAADKIGNVATGANPVTVKVDTIGPVVTAACVNATCTLSATAVSGIQQLLYSVDGSAFQPYTGAVNLGGNGLHKLSWSAQSFSGQIVTGSLDALVDLTPPTVQVTLCPSGPMFGGAQAYIPFTATGLDDLTGIAAWTVTLSPTGATHSGSGNGIWANLYNAQPGVYELSVQLTDGAGNTGNYPNVCQVTVLAGPAPVSATPTPTGRATYILLYTPTKTLTPSRTLTRKPTPTATWRPSATPTATAMPTDTATDMPTPTATETPTPIAPLPDAFVYEDTNGNGRCDEGEPGVGGQPFDVFLDGNLARQVTSAPSGLISLGDLAGSIELRYTGSRPVTAQPDFNAANAGRCPGVPSLGLAPLRPKSHFSLFALALFAWLMILPSLVLIRRRSKWRTRRALEALNQTRQHMTCTQARLDHLTQAEQKGD